MSNFQKTYIVNLNATSTVCNFNVTILQIRQWHEDNIRYTLSKKQTHKNIVLRANLINI